MGAPDESARQYTGDGFFVRRERHRLVGVFTRPMTPAAADALERALGPTPPTRYLHIAAPRMGLRLPSADATSMLRLRLSRLLRTFRALQGRAAFVVEATGFTAAAYRSFGMPVLRAAGLSADYDVFHDVSDAAVWLCHGDDDEPLEWAALVTRTRLAA